MPIAQQHRRKLDADLAELIGADFADKTAQLALMVVPADGEVHRLAKEIAARGGVVRHVLHRVNAVAAWIRLGMVSELAALDIVEEIEFDQPVHIA